MSVDILMPALPPTMEEGNLSKWHIKVGDTVSAGQVIAEAQSPFQRVTIIESARYGKGLLLEKF